MKLQSHKYKYARSMEVMYVFLLLLMTASTRALRFRGVCVQEEPVLTVYGLAITACEETCGSIVACQNLIYTRRILKCALYGSLTKLNKCKDHILISNTLTTGSTLYPGSGLQAIQYCPEMAENNNAVVLGNMNTIEAKRTIGCLPQYALDGAVSFNCLQNGSWLEPGSCVRVCAAPSHYADYLYTNVQIVTATGTMTLANPDAVTMQNLDYFVGSIVQVTCVDVASVIVDGPALVTCLQDGTWSARGICVKICSSPGHVQNLVYVRLMSRDGQTTDSPDTATVDSFLFASGSAVTVECSAGILVGSATVYCGASGAWGTFPVCQLTTMRMSCSSSSDCVDANSECRNGQCWCNPGLSYSPSDSTCVDQCQTYGNTFQDVPGYVIWLYNRISETKPNTTECRDSCESDSTCHSVEYDTANGKCYVNTHLPFQVGADFKKDSTYNYFQRDCA